MLGLIRPLNRIQPNPRKTTMKKIIKSFIACISLYILSVSISVNAELLVRQGGLAYYDTDRNITWLADANLAASNSFGVSGIIDGKMDFNTATAWITAMNADGITGYLGFNDWRMPTTMVLDPSCTDDPSGTIPTASNSIGYNCTGSEMGHLFYNVFKAVAGQRLDLSGDPIELSKFTNLQAVAGLYWSGTSFPNDPAIWAYDISFASGKQAIAGKPNSFLVTFVVRDGDIAPPTPVELIGALINSVISMNLKQGISNALDSKLENIIKALEDANSNNDGAAMNKLYAFINSVNAQRGGNITDLQADGLVSDAQDIIDLLF